MAHDDEELDWGEDDVEETLATMDVDPLGHSKSSSGVDGGIQLANGNEDQSFTPARVDGSQEQNSDTSLSRTTTQNGGVAKRDSRRTLSRSSSDFGKSLPSSLPQRPTANAPHVGRSDPLAASAMAPPSPSKSANTLSPNWEERKSRSNGAIYYFNIKTEETTWTRPVLETTSLSTAPTRPDSPTASRREREKKRPASPNVPTTLPPPPFSLPARPQFNSSQPRRDRSASPPPRARSRERQTEPERDSRGGRGDRRPAGVQGRSSPPPRTRDVHMRDPSPEPARRRRSPTPPAARDRGKPGGNRSYNARERSSPPAGRGQRPSPPPHRDERGPRRPEDRNPPPRNRSRSPPPIRRRSPPRPRDVRHPSPSSSSLPQKRRGDTPPPPAARSSIHPERYDGRDRNAQEETQIKRRRLEDDRDVYDNHVNGRDSRLGPRAVDDDRRSVEDPPKRAALPPQDQRFRNAVPKPRQRSPPRRSASPGGPPPGNLTSRVPLGNDINSSRGDVPAKERPQGSQPPRRQEKIKLPETNAAVAQAYNRRRVGGGKDEVPSPVNTEEPTYRDGPASKLPPSGPGGRVQRSYGPALRDGPPQPESFGSKEPPRGPRGATAVQRPPPARGRSPHRDPPPHSPITTQQPLDRNHSMVDREMSGRFGQQTAGPVSRREGGRGPNTDAISDRPMRVWGQPQATRPSQNSPETRGVDRDQDYDRSEAQGRSRPRMHDDVPYQGPGFSQIREPEQLFQGFEDFDDRRRPQVARQPRSESRFDQSTRPQVDGSYSRRSEQRPDSASQLRDRMDVDEDRQALTQSTRYPRNDGRDDGQSARSGRSLEEDYSQRPDPLPEARRLSIKEQDNERQHDRHREPSNFNSYRTREENEGYGNPHARESRSPRYAQPDSGRSRRLRSPSSGHADSSHVPASREVPEISSQKDVTVSVSGSEDFGAQRPTEPPRSSFSEQTANQGHNNGNGEGPRKETNTARVRIVRRELSPISTTSLSVGPEPGSAQPTPISVDSPKDAMEDRGLSSAGSVSGGRGSLLARLSVPVPSSSGDRSKGKGDHPGPSPGAGSSSSLQARMDNGERPMAGRRDSDDARKRKPRRGRGGLGGGKNRDTQG